MSVVQWFRGLVVERKTHAFHQNAEGVAFCRLLREVDSAHTCPGGLDGLPPTLTNFSTSGEVMLTRHRADSVAHLGHPAPV